MLLRSIMPSVKTVLINTVIWCLLYFVIGWNLHALALISGQQSTYLGTVWYTFTWYVPWTFLTPFLLTITATISHSSKHWFHHVCWNLSIFLGYFVVLTSLTTTLQFYRNGIAVPTNSFSDAYFQYLKTNHWTTDGFVYATYVVAGYLLAYIEKIKAAKDREVALQSELSRVELDALRSQLNPHFLFNTLNTISGLVRMKQEDKAVEALALISSMLRQVLENQSVPTISVQRELDFIENYLSIQKMRFSSLLNYDIEVSEKAKLADTPFMLLQTFVENAVLHGAQIDGLSNHIIVRGDAENGRVSFRIVNDITKHNKNNGFGIGQKNSHHRLSRLYGEQYILQSEVTEDDQYLIDVSFPEKAVNDCFR